MTDAELSKALEVEAERDQLRIEVAQLRGDLREIASQCHNLPRSVTADWIEKLATGEA